MLRLLAKLLKVLNSETEPGQISIALCLGMIAGLTPLISPHNLIVLLLALVLRVNLSSFILGTLFFSGVAYAMDPAFHTIGFKVLKAQALEGLFTSMYNNPLIRLTRFNNTILMGSLLASLAAFIPVAFLLNFLIRKYREHVLEWIRKTRIAQLVTGSKLYDIYQRVKILGDR
jgi:uncharacterized protein (TIGR03546 family)